MDELRRTAYHEAGHVMVALSLNYRVEKVSVLKAQFRRDPGRTAIPEMLHEDNVVAELLSLRREGVTLKQAKEKLSEWAKRDAVILMAGRAAEELSAGYYRVGGDRADLSQMMLGCVTQDPEKQNEILDAALKRAMEILYQRWSDVESLVTALLATKELDREEVEAILGEQG